MAETVLKASFGETSKEYARFRPTYPKDLLSIILKKINKPYENALDIGVGTGISTKMLSDVFESVTALEPDKKMIECGSFSGNINLINKSVEDIELTNNIFDLVTATNSFYWMEAEETLKKIHRWLRKDGVLAAYRYNLPLTDNEINEIIVYESERHWDRFRVQTRAFERFRVHLHKHKKLSVILRCGTTAHK